MGNLLHWSRSTSVCTAAQLDSLDDRPDRRPGGRGRGRTDSHACGLPVANTCNRSRPWDSDSERGGARGPPAAAAARWQWQCSGRRTNGTFDRRRRRTEHTRSRVRSQRRRRQRRVRARVSVALARGAFIVTGDRVIPGNGMLDLSVRRSVGQSGGPSLLPPNRERGIREWYCTARSMGLPPLRTEGANSWASERA